MLIINVTGSYHCGSYLFCKILTLHKYKKRFVIICALVDLRSVLSVHKQYFLFFSMLILIFVLSKLNPVIAYLKYDIAQEIEYFINCSNFNYDDMSR